MLKMRFNGMGGVSQFGGNFGPWIIAAMILKLVIFVAIVFIVYKIIRKHNFHSISAINVLNERYAKGEIEEEDYLKRKEVLKSK
jgi:putative membrane protein